MNDFSVLMALCDFIPVAFFAVAAVSPETRFNSDADAVFKSTPTAFTQSSTTASSAASNFFGGQSC